MWEASRKSPVQRQQGGRWECARANAPYPHSVCVSQIHMKNLDLSLQRLRLTHVQLL